VYVTVSTSTSGLLQFADWLTAKGITRALEPTGAYSKPVHEGELLLRLFTDRFISPACVGRGGCVSLNLVF
jgi:hypothetical protein